MSGALSLWLLSLCARKEKVTRRKGEKPNQGQWNCSGLKPDVGMAKRAGAANQVTRRKGEKRSEENAYTE
jgi:hypothetical protein